MNDSTITLEQRVEQLEKDLTQLKSQIPSASSEPWWEKIVGVFADDPDFEAAIALGRDYRQSLKPNLNTDE